MRIRRSLLKDSVTVAAYEGEGAYGAVYADAVTVPCAIDATRRLVRTSDGVEAVSEATLFAHPDSLGVLLPESLVTIDGRSSRVLAVSSQTLHGKSVFVKVACA